MNHPWMSGRKWRDASMDEYLWFLSKSGYSIRACCGGNLQLWQMNAVLDCSCFFHVSTEAVQWHRGHATPRPSSASALNVHIEIRTTFLLNVSLNNGLVAPQRPLIPSRGKWRIPDHYSCVVFVMAGMWRVIHKVLVRGFCELKRSPWRIDSHPAYDKQPSKIAAQASLGGVRRKQSRAGKYLSSKSDFALPGETRVRTERMHTVQNESSNKAVITEKCQVFHPAAVSSARSAAVEAQPTQSKVHINNRGHCGFSLIRGGSPLQSSTSEF